MVQARLQGEAPADRAAGDDTLEGDIAEDGTSIGADDLQQDEAQNVDGSVDEISGETDSVTGIDEQGDLFSEEVGDDLSQDSSEEENG